MPEPKKSPDLTAARRERGATQIGPWVLYPDLGVLRRESGEVRLNAKSLHVLLVLLDAGVKGVSRDQLLEQVWGANYPSDNVISRAMADLRAAFGEKAGEQKYIRTLPKFGYQFVAQHDELIAEEALPQNGERPLRTARRRRPMLAGIALLFVVAVLAAYFRPSEITESPLPALVGQRPLTSAPGLEHQPRIVPGSDWIVHAVMRRDRSDWDLFRVSLTDGAAQPVAVTPDVHEHGPAVSPRGDEVAYVRLSDGRCDVVVQSIALGVPQPVAQCARRFPTLVDWSPGADQLAFTVSQRDEPDRLRRLYLVDRYSGESRRLTSDVSPTGSDFYPRFSPDGSRVAFLRGEPQPDHRTTLWIVNVKSGAETRLTELPAQLGGMAWVDAERLIYSIAEAGSMRAYLLYTRTGVAIPIQSNGLMHPDYDPARGLLAVAEPKSDLDLALLTADGEATVIAQSTSDDHHGRLSADENWLAFVSRRSGFDELWIAATNSDASRRLTRFDGAAVRYPDWHPDGDRILMTVQTTGGERLFEVDIVSGAATQIAAPFLDLTTPRWMPDGDGWVSACRDDSGWGICLGRDGAVTRVADGFYRPNPTDRDTIFVVDDAGELLQMSLSDGSTSKAWNGLPANGRYGWEVWHGFLFFLTSGTHGNSGSLLRRNLDSGVTDTLYSGAMPVADTAISIGQQSGKILVTLLQTSSDDLAVYEKIYFD